MHLLCVHDNNFELRNKVVDELTNPYLMEKFRSAMPLNITRPGDSKPHVKKEVANVVCDATMISWDVLFTFCFGMIYFTLSM